MHSKKGKHGSGKAVAEAPGEQIPTLREIKKDVQALVNQHTLWKDKNHWQRDRIVELGGRKPKGEKRTLAVHLQRTKKKKERERRQLQENVKHGISGGDSWEARHSLTTTKSGGSKNKPERALKCSEGHFKGGVLNVKHLLNPTTPSSGGGGRDSTTSSGYRGKGKKRKGGGKKKGKGRR